MSGEILKEETRGKIEKDIDGLKLEFPFREIERIQEITPIGNIEEFLLGYILGWWRRDSEVTVLLNEKGMTETDEEEIRKIILTRIPEMRKKLMQYLNR